MVSPRTRASRWFLAVAVGMLAVLSWLTAVLLQLDTDEHEARRQAAAQERLRLALWRMDSWLSPQLARESMRPASDYLAFPSAGNAWTRGFSKIGPNEILVQSPLLGAESKLFPLHFEIDPASGQTNFLCSPQVPRGNERDFAEANGIASDVLERARTRLADLARSLPLQAFQQKVSGAVARLPTLGCNIDLPQGPAPQRGTLQQQEVQQLQQSVQELDNRQRNFLANVASDQQRTNPLSYLVTEDETIGPMVPVWVEGGEPILLFARRVQRAGAARLQAVLVDWQVLQQEMVALVEDLYESTDARLVRCEQPTPAEQPSMLASVPARLVADFRGAIDATELPITSILWVTWGVTLLGLLALGFTLRTAIGFGERRARFASAVTHELRTPLTTFRMYSEMLAEGVVKDPDARREYLLTLQRESDRLARVVENVLAWSRLEEGRFTSRRVRVRVEELVHRIVPVLGQRLGEVDMMLDVQVDDRARDTVVVTDEDAVGQILFNLVDNAAKYAREAADRAVRLSVAAGDDRVALTLCDAGPGIAAEHRDTVFVPFDRGAVPGGSNDLPGVGLGLPLARGLARDLDGDLFLREGPGGGACFVLELPLA